jgi:hypothetical protein
MAGSLLVVALVMLGSGPEERAGPDPSALVERLASPRPAERAAAVEALEKLGEDALPALRAVRFGATDLVLRARAAAVLDAIEAQRLTHATMVRLDIHDRPLPEVLARLGESTGMKLVLGFDPDPNRQVRSITLDAPEPVPFWTAIDRLCREAELRLAPPGMNGGVAGVMLPALPGQPPRRPLDGTELVLVHQDPTNGGGLAPTSDFGPFRFRLLSLQLVRDRSFLRFPQPGFMPRPSGMDAERFEAHVEVWSEPRLTVLHVGEVSALEARDDLGHSLRPDPVAPTPGRPPFPTFNGFAGRSGSVSIRLKYPDSPGKSITRLAGRVPVTVAARKPNPLVVSLADDRGRTFRDDDITLVVHEVKTEPNTKVTIVELTLTSDHPGQGGGLPTNLDIDNRLSLRMPNAALNQVEFLDAQGRVCLSHQNGLNVGPAGMRRSYRINPVDGVGPPVQVRYHGLDWASIEVPFAFQDLPMP